MGFTLPAPSLTVAEYPFAGWIWDAALSVGAPIASRTEGYITVRSIGGGSEGTATDAREAWTQSRAGGDERFTANALTTVVLSAGFRLVL